MKEYWEKIRQQIREKANTEFELYKNDPLFIAGLMLYWSEGDNGTNSCICRFTNSDPRMVKVFVSFAIRFCDVKPEKIRLSLLLYPDLNEEVSRKFWGNYLHIPSNQFYKVQYIIGKHQVKKLAHGVCTVYIGGLAQKLKIKTCISCFAENYNAAMVQW